MMVEGNDDIELSLGLSIGGCFGKSEKLVPIRQKSVSTMSGIEAESGETDMDFRSNVSRNSGSGEGKEVEVGGEVLDHQRKREIQALRRQEARKKREEKQQQKKARGDHNGGIMKTSSMEEIMFLQPQEEYQLSIPMVDRDSMKNERSGSGRIFKKVKVIDDGVNQISKQSENSNASSAFSSPFPVVPMQYPCSNHEYVHYPNGFVFPYAVPYWAGSSPAPPPPAAAPGDDKNVLQQPIACRAFRPFQTHSSILNRNLSGSCDSEQNESKGGGGRVKLVQSSLCSSGSSSSGASDYQSNLGGGCSSDTRSHSHSSRSASEQHQLHTTVVNKAPGQSEYSASSQPLESTHRGMGGIGQNAEKLQVSSSITNPKRPEEKPISITEPLPINKPITTTDNPPAPPPPPPHSEPSQAPREAKGGESSRPPTPPQQQQSLPHMPFVSTTGNGPNGKTITGFLYRYTKTEVSIMCVCHGSSFTPAEFVKHAGGIDVSHPLKRIVVVPSTF